MWSMQLEVERMPVKSPLSGTDNMVVIIYLILNLSLFLSIFTGTDGYTQL